MRLCGGVYKFLYVFINVLFCQLMYRVMKNDFNLLIEVYCQEVFYFEDEMKKSVEQFDFKVVVFF